MQRTTQPVTFKRGDHIEVAEGELKGLPGTVDSVTGDEAIVVIRLQQTPAADGGDGGAAEMPREVEVRACAG